MFSWSEILLIAVVALIFIGPKELPAILHKLGQMTASLRRSAEEFRRHFEQSMREAGYEDLNKNINDLRSLNPSTQLRATIDNAINQKLRADAPACGRSTVRGAFVRERRTGWRDTGGGGRGRSSSFRARHAGR